MTHAAALAKQFSELGLFVNVVAETLMPGVNLTYSAADAVDFDGVVIASGAESIFLNGTSPLYPLGRPLEIVRNAYDFGKPVGAVGSSTTVFSFAGIKSTPGVYLTNDTATLTADFKAGLMQYKFLDRFPLDPTATNSSMPMSTSTMPEATSMPSSTGTWHKHRKSEKSQSTGK
jgi:catalase